MNIERLERALITAARRHPPSDAVPYAFDQRVMRQILKGSPRLEETFGSFPALWRPVLAAVAAAAVMVTVDRVVPDPSLAQVNEPWSGAALEETLLASASPEDAGW